METKHGAVGLRNQDGETGEAKREDGWDSPYPTSKVLVLQSLIPCASFSPLTEALQNWEYCPPGAYKSK